MMGAFESLTVSAAALLMNMVIPSSGAVFGIGWPGANLPMCKRVVSSELFLCKSGVSIKDSNDCLKLKCGRWREESTRQAALKVPCRRARPGPCGIVRALCQDATAGVLFRAGIDHP